MVYTIGASSSLTGHNLLCQRPLSKDIRFKQQQLASCRLSVGEFMAQQSSIGPCTPIATSRQRCNRSVDLTIKSLAMGLTKENKNPSKEGRQRIAHDVGYTADTRGPRPCRFLSPGNNADDDLRIHIPALRHERLGCGWFAVIFEWEGVIVEDDTELDNEVWLALSQEEGRSPPLAFDLKRIEGMKCEQAISEVLCWSRDPTELRRLASRKEEIYRSLRNGSCYHLRPGSEEFMTTLANHSVPLAVASTRPRKILEEAIEAVGLQSFLAVVVAAEDVHRGKPDPEMFEYTGQLLNLMRERCVVFGNSNLAVEAAHDARMKCVAVASKHPVYELHAAERVVMRLDELSVVDLKSLADVDDPSPELEFE